MANWLIIRNKKIVEGPFGWDARKLNQSIQKLGYSVSFSVCEPPFNNPLFFGENDVGVVPMEIVAPEPLETQVRNPTPIIEVLTNSVRYTYTLRDKTPEELNPPPPAPVLPTEDQLKQWALENKYLEATRSLIELSGQIPSVDWPKLEDVEFEQIAMIAATNNIAITTLLLSTLNYTFFQLKLLNVRWEDIQHHSS